ncbi:MAG: AraC family transcriptional regulator [Deltaproteobacteria bacterium]|jgi:AraC-like DNA-binding protein|nr:AraC family transcriptional regulator [Deltaproteobacteria bacterium]
MGAAISSNPRPFDRFFGTGYREVILFPELLALPPEFIHSVGFIEAGQSPHRDSAWRRGDFDLASIRCTVNGRSVLHYDGREFVAEAGDVMVLYSPSECRCHVDASERWEFFYVTLCGRAAVRAMREITATMGPVFALELRSRTLALTADACLSALQGTISSPRHASEIAHTIVSSMRSETLGQLSQSSAPRASTPDLFFEVEQFCLKNLSRPIGVEDMARVARMSRYYFTRKFGKKRGVSPGHYLASLRLDEAKRLLAQGGLTVKEVAVQCGYSDANYFGKVFRKNLGISPGSLRFAGRKGNNRTSDQPLASQQTCRMGSPAPAPRRAECAS